nr:hypothetical protein [Spirochaetaceae bacterium]
VLLAGLKNRYAHCVPISAKNKIGIEDLKIRITEEIEKEYGLIDLFIPADKWDVTAYIHRNGKILKEEYEDDGVNIQAVLSQKDKNILSSYIKDK